MLLYDAAITVPLRLLLLLVADVGITHRHPQHRTSIKSLCGASPANSCRLPDAGLIRGRIISA